RLWKGLSSRHQIARFHARYSQGRPPLAVRALLKLYPARQDVSLMTDRLRAVFVLPNCRAPDLSRYRRRTSAACPGSRMRPIAVGVAVLLSGCAMGPDAVLPTTPERSE